MKPFLFSLFAGLPALSALAGPFTVGPDYHRPEVAAPAAYRDLSDARAWRPAAPAAVRGPWWRLFGDAALDGFETRALAANENLHAAAAHVDQARAAAGLARSAYWPQLAAGATLNREQTSTTTENALRVPLATTARAPLSAAWEIDLFGRVRRQSESARAEVAAGAADFENVRLALTAEVASTYFALRALDREAVSTCAAAPSPW
jgi:multidrug efflux system outer membrane protein